MLENFPLFCPKYLTRTAALSNQGRRVLYQFIAPHLFRLLYALERPVRFVLSDGDVVEQKNLVRQNFIAADLGENKAKVLAERYSSVFGLETEYIPAFIEDKERLKQLLSPRKWSERQSYESGKWHNYCVTELVILLGCVDNNKSRALCHKVFFQSENLVYIDSGNGEFSGQVVCGIRAGGRTMQKPVGTLYPEILDASDKFPTELSCAEASVSAPQSITANITAACAVVDMVYNILVRGETDVCAVAFSTTNINVKPTIKERKRGKTASRGAWAAPPPHVPHLIGQLPLSKVKTENVWLHRSPGGRGYTGEGHCPAAREVRCVRRRFGSFGQEPKLPRTRAIKSAAHPRRICMCCKTTRRDRYKSVYFPQKRHYTKGKRTQGFFALCHFGR